MSFNAFPISTSPFSSYSGPVAALSFGGQITYSGISSAGNSWLYHVGNLIGTASKDANGNLSPFSFFISGDSVDTSGAGLTGWNVEHATSTGHTGGRTAIQAREAIVGAPPSGSYNYTALAGITRCSANLGGSTGAYANYLGAAFGGNSNVFLTAGATFLKIVNGHEFDVAVPSTASTAEKLGITIIKTANDGSRGVFDDSALGFNDQDNTTVTWKYGISFGAYAHKWSFGTDSTLIIAQQRQVGPASSSVALNGIDFTNVTFSGSPILMPLMTPASSSDTGTTGAIKWDANYVYVCVATNTWKRAALSSF